MRDPKVSNVPNESKLQRALMPNSRMFLLFLIVFAVLTFLFSDRLWLSIGEGVIILLLIIYSVIMRARKRRTLERYIESVTYDTESARNNTLQNIPTCQSARRVPTTHPRSGLGGKKIERSLTSIITRYCTAMASLRISASHGFARGS